jgi:hypothetical protein
MATSDAATVAQWWKEWPLANIGLVTAPSGLLVLDIDPRNHGDDSLYELEREHGALPETWRSQTAGGGEHVYLGRPDGDLHTKNLGPGIDLPLNVVVPPSAIEGRGAYLWLAGFGPDDVPLAACPQWLRELLQGAHPSGSERPNGAAKPPGWWRTLVTDGVGEGQRNTTKNLN